MIIILTAVFKELLRLVQFENGQFGSVDFCIEEALYYLKREINILHKPVLSFFSPLRHLFNPAPVICHFVSTHIHFTHSHDIFLTNYVQNLYYKVRKLTPCIELYITPKGNFRDTQNIFFLGPKNSSETLSEHIVLFLLQLKKLTFGSFFPKSSLRTKG